MNTARANRMLAILLPAFAGLATDAVAIEEPNYTVIEEARNYEVRQYAPYIVAETEVQGDIKDAGNQAFRILAGYIFGDNRSNTKMAMTAPVESSAAPASEKMKMTAPVISETTDASDTAHVYRFVMESKYTLDTLPVPNDSRITIRTIEPRTVAVRRFSGFWSENNFDKNEQLLLQQLKQDGVRTTGEPQLARYNGPFTPWFLRRNEIMIEVDWPDS